MSTRLVALSAWLATIFGWAPLESIRTSVGVP
jgi:hypothetical protein